MDFHGTRRGLMAGAALSLIAGQASAQRPFPSGPVRLISPYTPGGGTDTTARVISPAMTAFLGQPVIVDNRAGAAGAIGAAEVSRAEGDGQTLLIDSLGHVVNPFLLRGLTFDYASLIAVTQVTRLPQILIAPVNTPATDLAGFIAYLRSRRGELAYGSSGNASGAHLASVLFLRATGTDLVHVPYRGGSAAMQDVLAGNVAFAFATVNSATGLVQDGRLKAFAVASATRVPSLPNVPTLPESGFPDVIVDEWNTIFAPQGTPRPVVDRIYEAVRHAIGTPAVRERFAGIGAELVGSTPDEAARFIAGRREAMRELVRSSNISID